MNKSWPFLVILLALLGSGCSGAVETLPPATLRAAGSGPARPTYTPIQPTDTATPLPAPGVTTPYALESSTTPGGPPAAEPGAGSTPAPSTPADDVTIRAQGEAEIPPDRLPQIHAFAIKPTSIDVGGRVYLTWDARGDKATLCPMTYLNWVQRPCLDVPLTGSQYVTIYSDADSWDYRGFELRVTAHQQEVVEFQPLTITCPDSDKWWFFYRPEDTRSLPCPLSKPVESGGAAQHFESGSLLWSRDLGQVFAIFNDGTYQVFYDLISRGEVTISETPPPGTFAPVSGFGLLWRGEAPGSESLRERLGWATDKEAPVETAHQCYAENGGVTCFLLAPDRSVLKLNPDRTWTVWVEN